MRMKRSCVVDEAGGAGQTRPVPAGTGRYHAIRTVSADAAGTRDAGHAIAAVPEPQAELA